VGLTEAGAALAIAKTYGNGHHTDSALVSRKIPRLSLENALNSIKQSAEKQP
jgi:hypothetical protein